MSGHTSDTLAHVLERTVLPRVQKPSRYLGAEYNAVHKNPGDVEVRVALAFPDLYDLGLGNLGLLILYAILNDIPWCWAERAYAPGMDMEDELRRRGLPLFTNESKTALAEMDLVGFTLQSELTYTNVVNMLGLGGIPVRSQHRGDGYPLVMAGGPNALNPEPMAPFIDFFVIGEAEEAIGEVVACVRAMKGRPRTEALEALNQLDGVYVPALTPVRATPAGTLVAATGTEFVHRRVVDDLDQAPFPVRYVVPFTQQVHDRVGIEVLRGCTRGCRFCHAGMTTRPVRERSVEEIDRLMTEALSETGYEEVSLLSLSTCDHSRAGTLVHQAAGRAAQGDFSVALPSLRLDSFSVDLADQVTGVRRSALTFAPEAATERLRAVINKPVSEDDLVGLCAEAFQRGWGHVKLYFMLGLPTERDEDVLAIADLCRRILEHGRKIKPGARLNLGVSTFVPKPFTPFQWAAQISYDEARRRHRLLGEALSRVRGVKFGYHNPKATFIEGLISRGDRRTADLIEAAWRQGARFESSDEFFDWDAWTAAVRETGYDAEAALSEWPLDADLPWDHIDPGVRKEWLVQEWHNALDGVQTPDCRHAPCNQCGVNTRRGPLCDAMRQTARSAQAESASEPLSPASTDRARQVQRLRFRIGREGEVRFLSHLQLVSAWLRALRRADAPLAYSQGFHAHPKLTFSSAPPVGEESGGDYMDVILCERVEPDVFLERLRQRLPRGFLVFDVHETPVRGPALMSLARGFAYVFSAEADPGAVKARAQALLAASEILVERKDKSKKGKGKRRGTKQVDIRPMIAGLEVSPAGEHSVEVHARLNLVDGRGAKPMEIIGHLGLDPMETRIYKTATYLSEEAGQDSAVR